MFGMVAATGIKILTQARLQERNNSLVVAVSIGVGMIPLVAPTMLARLPGWAAPLVHSGITLAAVSAVSLNFLFNEYAPSAVSLPASGMLRRNDGDTERVEPLAENR
jgi:NCS2 family nucleobase:cation symporter-2